MLIPRNAALHVFGIILLYHSLCFLFLCCNESVKLVSCVFSKSVTLLQQQVFSRRSQHSLCICSLRQTDPQQSTVERPA